MNIWPWSKIKRLKKENGRLEHKASQLEQKYARMEERLGAMVRIIPSVPNPNESQIAVRFSTLTAHNFENKISLIQHCRDRLCNMIEVELQRHLGLVQRPSRGRSCMGCRHEQSRMSAHCVEMLHPNCLGCHRNEPMQDNYGEFPPVPAVRVGLTRPSGSDIIHGRGGHSGEEEEA